MRGGIWTRGGSGGAFAAVVALVLLFRLLIPAGYMIGPADGGRTALILCGAAPAPDRNEGHGAGHEAPSTAETPCPYAALTAPVLPPAPPAVPPREASAAPSEPSPALRSARPALAAPPPPATGPPAAV